MKTYGSLAITEDGWALTAEPHILLRAKRVFERMQKSQHGTVTLSDSPENCRDLAWLIERYPVQMSGEDRVRLNRGRDEHREHVLSLEQMIDPSYTPPQAKMELPARNYQLVANAIYLKQGYLLLGDDVGLGKSCSAICSFSDSRTLPAVVVAFPHLQMQWADEIKKFLPDLFVHVVKTMKPYELPRWSCPDCAKSKKKKALSGLFKCPNERCGRGPDVIIITYSKLAGWAEVLRGYAKSIVFDEIQELRHPGSNKYNAAAHVAEGCSHKIGLSATPIYNYGEEVFNLYEILCPGRLGTRAEFQREWTHHHQKGKITDPVAFGSYLRENMLLLRRTRQEVGRELPPINRIPYRIDCDPEALNKIEDSASELAKIILAQTEDRRGQKLEASQELSNIVRQATGIAKAPYVADFVRLLVESGEKVLLCGWHRAVYEIWEHKLKGLRIGWYTGSESPAAKQTTAKAAIEGELDVVIMSLRSGAGLNGLQHHFKVAVFGELDWSPAVHHQVIGREARDGQTDPVTAYFLVSDGGCDPLMADALGIKSNQLKGITSPSGDPIEAMQIDPGHIKRLAEQYLGRKGVNPDPALRHTA